MAEITMPRLSGGARPSGRVKASPVARRLAARLGVPLDGLNGTGPGGRVVKVDIERAAAHRTATVPEFTVTTEVEMDASLELRSRLAELEIEPLPSINDLVLRASALSLRAHPGVNAGYADGRIEVYGRVNVAVAVPTPGVLLVPVVSDADTKTLAQLAAETRALAERARSSALTPSEVGDATFTISNLGMYGITQFSAILNPPQAAILAVGSIREHAVVRDGDLVSRRRMTLTLTCDHRILYGADAALFLQSIRTTLEHPLKLLV